MMRDAGERVPMLPMPAVVVGEKHPHGLPVRFDTDVPPPHENENHRGKITRGVLPSLEKSNGRRTDAKVQSESDCRLEDRRF